MADTKHSCKVHEKCKATMSPTAVAAVEKEAVNHRRNREKAVAAKSKAAVLVALGVVVVAAIVAEAVVAARLDAVAVAVAVAAGAAVAAAVIAAAAAKPKAVPAAVTAVAGLLIIMV